jgi:hypothetical protein
VLKKVFQEPLVQFLLLGGVLYFYYVSTQESVSNKSTISFSPFEVEQIKKSYQEKFGKEISKELFNALLAKKSYEKILLSEAQTLGIAQTDSQISELLLEKMEFLLSNSVEVLEPSEEELKEFYKRNIVDYSELKSLSFYQIYFLQEDSKEIQEHLKLLVVTDVNGSIGAGLSQNSTYPKHIQNISKAEVEKMFGKYFAFKLFESTLNEWSGPIKLQEGESLIYVDSKEPSQALLFDEVQDRVYRDFMRKKRETVKRDAYAKLATQYKVEVK